MDSLANWRAFYLVAQEGSFTAAAAVMNCGVGNVSKQVALLEGALGVKLLQRSTRRVALTNEGEELLPRVEALLEDLASLENTFHGKSGLTGMLRIACLPGLSRHFLAPALAQFALLHPLLKFEVQLADRVVDLIEEQIDLAIRTHGGSDSTLVLKKLSTMNLKLCAAPSYLQSCTAWPLKKPDDLAHHRLLMLPAHCKCRFKDSNRKLGDFFDSVTIHSQEGSFLTDMALAGAGIVVRADWDVVDYLRTGQLVEVLPAFPLASYGDICVAFPSRKLLPQRTRAFLDFLCQRVVGTD